MESVESPVQKHSLVDQGDHTGQVRVQNNSNPQIFGDLRRLRDLGAFGKSEQNQSKQNQVTYRQGLPKVCVQQFHSQDEDQFWIFWALSVQFGLGIMCQEGFWEL